MSHQSELIATDIESYLAEHERKELLRLLTCGSVDDGKSTLIGRLLFDSKMLYDDQLSSLRKESATHGTTGGDFDPALVTDGLKAEREQGITIDVAYRYFSTTNRKFIIADTPGHEQYTRNMATGASNCDLAVILVDARNGVVTQTRRHAFITSLLGIRHLVVAINKMDLVDYSESAFNQIQSDFTGFAAKLDTRDIHYIPISALDGDNVVEPSDNMPWYRGATLMHHLENVHIASDRNLIDFRMPVQYVSRPNLDFRGYCGTIASGIVRPGDDVMVLPSRKSSQVKSIVTYDGELNEAFAPIAVTVTLEDEIDVSRGDVLVHPGNQPRVADRIEAMVVWMAEEPMVPGKRYIIKHSTKSVRGAVSQLRYQIDVNTLHRQEAATLRLNEIGRCTIELNQPISYDAYQVNRGTGALIVIDAVTNATVAAGMILRRRSEEDAGPHWDTEPASEHLITHYSRVSEADRRTRFGQRPTTLFLTGISGAGKSTLGFALERKLFDLGHAVFVLDGQNLRQGMNKDLGFSVSDRSEAVRRGSEMAKVMNDAGMLCVCAYVAPTADIRTRAREVVGPDRFLLVHVDAPLEVCRERDTQGVYALADAGEIANLPGITSDYEAPKDPDLYLDTSKLDVDTCVQQILDLLRRRDALG
ncbi:MAG: sulfate adenylyltransferase subunit CysN [Pseudomonadota bacterium]